MKKAMLAVAILMLIPGTALAPSSANEAPVSEVWVANQALNKIQIISEGALVDEIDLSGVVAGPHLVDFSRSGEFAFAGGVVDGGIASIRTSDRTIVDSLMIPGAPAPLVHQAMPTPDGTRLVVAHIANKTLYEVEVAADGTLALGDHFLMLSKAPICTVFSGDKAYVSLASSGVAVVDLTSWTQVGSELPTSGAVQCGMHPLPNGTFLVSSNGGTDATVGVLYRLDPADDSLTELGPVPGADVHGLTVSSSGQRAFATARKSEVLSVMKAADGSLLRTLSLDLTLDTPDTPDAIDYLGGKVYMTLRERGAVAIVDGNGTRTIELGGNLVHGLSVLDRTSPRPRIAQPKHGATLDGARFERATGSVIDDASFIAGARIALRKKTTAGCRWWDPDARKLAARACDDPLWFRPTGSSDWSYRFGSLAAGRYHLRLRAVDEAGHRGRTYSNFMIR